MADPYPIVIRPAATTDVDLLLEFIEPFVLDHRLLPRTIEELNELVATGFVAIIDQKIVGFAALEIYSKKLAEVRSLAVSPIYQGHGIGKRLVTACVDLAKSRKILEVLAVTSAEEFFLSCGFDFTLPGEKKALFYDASLPAAEPPAPSESPASEDSPEA